MLASSKKQKKVQTSSIASCHLQVLGTGGGELKPSLFLFTDSKRYLFNCVENVQRFCNEYRVRQSKLSNFFVTRLAWDNVGGLPGQLLQFANFFDVEKLNPIRLHGPEALSDLVHCSRFHVNSGKIRLETQDTMEEVRGHFLPVYRDENITVHTLNMAATSLHSSPVSSGTESESDDVASRPPKKARISRSPRNSISVFLCKLADVPGKFNPQRAAELGLPKGPSYRALVNGESVTAPDGTVVHPSDVLGPTRVGPTFVVLEVPHQSYVSAITSHPLLQKSSFDEFGECVTLIAHMTPRDVLESDEYSQWMASFGPNTKHLLLHKSLCPPDWTLRGILKSHGPLNLLEPSLFREFSTPSPEAGSDNKNDLRIFKFLPRESVIVGRTLLHYHLKPTQREGVDESQVLEPFSSFWEGHMARIRSSLDIRKALAKLPEREKSKPSLARNHSPPSLTATEDQVTFLGTGASCPSKYRNVSSILLQTCSGGNIMFDSGEGTLAQLYRHFGTGEGDRVLAKLGVIFISHIHGDHNLGIISLLRTRTEILRRDVLSPSEVVPTRVVGPRKVGWWLKDYSRRCERLHYHFIDSNTLTEDGRSLVGGLSVQTVPVIHCTESYGAVVSCGEHWRVVYSGDTRPCPALIAAGKNATLLLHEATLEDGMVAEAEEKKHCTISQALQVAEEMNSKFTILTHFSQRYSKFLPLILNRKKELKSRVFPAFDHLTVSLTEVEQLPGLLPAVQDILACTKEDDDIPLSWGW